MNKEQEKEYQRHLTSLDKDTLISLYLQKCYDADIEIADLEAKLAEKEKEIEEITHKNSRLIQGIFWGNGLQFSHEVKKDKTDFAIEMLEKVKDDFFDVGNGWWLCFRDGTQYMTHNELEGCVRDVIDQQIKELKEEK